jgi:hypothetical protein
MLGWFRFVFRARRLSGGLCVIALTTASFASVGGVAAAAVPAEDRLYYSTSPDLWSVDPDGTGPRRLGSGVCGNSPALAPDGQAIAYHSCEGDISAPAPVHRTLW